MNRKQILAVYVFAALFTSMTVSVAYSQRADPQVLTQNEIQDKERAMYLKIIENGDPVADFYEAQADTPQERNIRQSKNAKGDVKSKPAPLDWQRGELGITMRTDQFVEPAFPVEANLVAFGIVNRAEAHVSPDRTDIFSQFDFQIEKILKDATSENHQQENPITLTRAGGKVLLPDGRICYLGEDGVYMPKQGREICYVLKVRQ